MDPLWNSLVIGGLQPGKDGQLQPFLGTIGMIGTHYEDAHIATGKYTLNVGADGMHILVSSWCMKGT